MIKTLTCDRLKKKDERTLSFKLLGKYIFLNSQVEDILVLSLPTDFEHVFAH